MLKDATPYPQILSSIFSHNLMRSLINHAKEDDRSLHRTAEKSLKLVQQTVEADPSTAVTILPRLVGGNGVYSFDQVTNMKTVHKILAQVEDDQAAAVIEGLLAPVKVVKT